MELFDMDFEDWEGTCGEAEYARVICEGCGPTVVDHTGKCVAADCLRRHGAVKRRKKNRSHFV
jgi:hypothetical protein